MAFSGYVKNISKLSGAAAIGQLLAAAVMPIITKLYTPTEVGQLGLYISLLGFVSSFSMLRYEAAIPICDNDIEAVNVLAVGCVFSVLIGVLASFAVFIITVMGYRAHPAVAFIIPISIMLTALYMALSSWAVRKQDFTAIAKTRLSQSIGMTVMQIGLGWLQYGSVGLVLGHAFGQSGGLSFLFKSFKQNYWGLISGLNLRSMMFCLKKYKRYPQFSAFASALNASLDSMPVVFFVAIYPGEIAGWYTLAMKLLFVPASILNTGLSQVNYGAFSSLGIKNLNQVQKLFFRRSKQMFIVAGGFCSVLTGVLYFLVPLLFGPEWHGVTLFILLLAPAMMLNLMTSSFGCILDVLHRQDLHLKREVVRSLNIAIALSACWFFGFSWETSLITLSVMYCVGSIAYFSFSLLAIWGMDFNFRLFRLLISRSINFFKPSLVNDCIYEIRNDRFLYEKCSLREGELFFPVSPEEFSEKDLENVTVDPKKWLCREFKHESLAVVKCDGLIVFRSLMRLSGNVDGNKIKKIRKLPPNCAFIHSCETALMYRGKGIYPFAISKMAQVAFLEFGISRIWITCSIFNLPSRRGIEKAGFVLMRFIKGISVFNGRVFLGWNQLPTDKKRWLIPTFKVVIK